MRKSAFRLFVFTVAVAWSGIYTSAQTIQVNQNNRTIAVKVSDVAKADADTATVHIGFEVYAPDAESAYASGSQISNAVVDALRKSGVDDKAVESDAQNLQRNMQFNDKDSDLERAKKQFVLMQSWTVKTAAADAAKVLNTAVEAGANNSGQIDWDLKDRQGLQAQAAAKALQRAQVMADQMAKGLNAKLGALIYASNQMPETPTVFANAAMAPRMLMERKVAPLAIRAQKIEETAVVYAVFAIE
jgi:uncharacterized protein